MLETLEIITNEDLIAINQSQYVYQARRLIDYGELEVWGRPLVSTMSGEIAVALLNRSNEPQTIAFSLDSAGLDPVKRYTIKDLWTKETFDVSYEQKISRQVSGHAVVVLQIKGSALPYNFFQFDDKKK